NLVHLSAGMCQRTGGVIAQAAGEAKSNEIPKLRALLATLDIVDAVITADALHCRREAAEYITDHGGHYRLTVEHNQRLLRTTLKRLPWKQVPVADSSTASGHGRRERRTLKAAALDMGIGFPGAEQVLRITRTRTHRKTGRRSIETVYAVTSLAATDATPQ